MFELVDQSEFHLLYYSARQSTCSIGRDATHCLPEDPVLPNAFQKRMVLADGKGDAWVRMRSLRFHIDVVLWDLTDERFGVYQFPDDSFITRSIEIQQLMESANFADARLLEFGSDEHFEVWTRRTRALIRSMKNADLFHKTLVMRVPWAEYTSQGDPTPRVLGSLQRKQI